MELGCHSHELRLDITMRHTHNVNYNVLSSISIFFLLSFLQLVRPFVYVKAMKNNPGALASLKINIFIIIGLHRVQMKSICRGERFKDNRSAWHKWYFKYPHQKMSRCPNRFTGIDWFFIRGKFGGARLVDNIIWAQNKILMR